MKVLEKIEQKNKFRPTFLVESVPFSNPQEERFTYIDLFAGIGGFRLAMRAEGGACLYSSEWNDAAQNTYEANFGEIPHGDITFESTKAAIPEKFDILAAGFPCQAFSVAGYQKGFEDTRGTLFFDICTILERHRPRAFILENVKNLVSHDKGRTFKVMRRALEDELGYIIHHKVLNTLTHANIPQNRERIFIVGFDPEQVHDWRQFRFPEKLALTSTIHDCLVNERVDDKYYYQPEHMYYPELARSVTNRDTVYQWRRVYVRENKNNACPTLTANMGAGGHNVPIIKDDYGIRKLTPRECFNFQGFPREYILPDIADSKLYMQAGNSVTVPLVHRVVKKMVETLKL